MLTFGYFQLQLRILLEILKRFCQAVLWPRGVNTRRKLCLTVRQRLIRTKQWLIRFELVFRLIVRNILKYEVPQFAILVTRAKSVSISFYIDLKRKKKLLIDQFKCGYDGQVFFCHFPNHDSAVFQLYHILNFKESKGIFEWTICVVTNTIPAETLFRQVLYHPTSYSHHGKYKTIEVKRTFPGCVTKRIYHFQMALFICFFLISLLNIVLFSISQGSKPLCVSQLLEFIKNQTLKFQVR